MNMQKLKYPFDWASVLTKKTIKMSSDSNTTGDLITILLFNQILATKITPKKEKK